MLETTPNQQALIYHAVNGDKLVLEWNSQDFAYFIEEFGRDDSDLSLRVQSDAPFGVVIFEGDYKFGISGPPDSQDYDCYFKGTLRRLTPGEAAVLQEGGHLFISPAWEPGEPRDE